MKHTRATTIAALTATIMATGFIGLSAGTADALPISNLQSECRGAGGSWVVDYGYNSTGIRYVTGYECWYKDIDGNLWVDLYDRKGNYRNTG